jgi:hypothetical protein
MDGWVGGLDLIEQITGLQWLQISLIHIELFQRKPTL